MWQFTTYRPVVQRGGDRCVCVWQVAQVTPKPLKRMLSSRPSSRKATTEDKEEDHVPHRNALSSTSAEGAPTPTPPKSQRAEVMRRAQTAPFPLSEHDEQGISLSPDGMSLNVAPPQLGGSSAAKATGEDRASPIGSAHTWHAAHTSQGLLFCTS